MAKRKRSSTPQVSQPARPISNRVRRNPTPRNRNTFAVARANEVIKAELPHLIYQGREATKRARVVQEEPVYSSPAPVAAKATPRPGQKPQDLRVKQMPTDCRPRPVKTSGNGSGRPFAGRWCS